MKILIELASEDALELGRMHAMYMKAGVKLLSIFPLEYSNNARIVNEFHRQMIEQLTTEEVERVKDKIQTDLYGW